jgi:hypothetical protein
VTPTRTFAFALSAAALIAAACQNTPTGYCTAPFHPAVIVTPLDSGTGANVVVGTRGVALTGTEVDSLRPVDSVLWGGVRRGIYDVTVEHAGYRQWVRRGIQVKDGGACGVLVSVHMTALLQPSP